MKELILLSPRDGFYKARGERKRTQLLSLSVSPLTICFKGWVTGYNDVKHRLGNVYSMTRLIKGLVLKPS